MPAVSFPLPKVNQNIFLFSYSVFYMTITQTFKHIILTLAHSQKIFIFWQFYLNYFLQNIVYSSIFKHSVTK